MKNFLIGFIVIVIVVAGGLVYRNAVEHPSQPIACPLDALVCPDGTAVSRTGSSCTFPACPPPNVTLSEAKIAYAVPSGFESAEIPDAAAIAAYDVSSASSTPAGSIIIRRYALDASTTPLSVIQQTAISGPSGLPAPVTAFTSTVLGSRRYTVVTIERFEGVIDVAYYLSRDTDVLRFDAIDREVGNWTDANLDMKSLPTRTALEKMLASAQML